MDLYKRTPDGRLAYYDGFLAGLQMAGLSDESIDTLMDMALELHEIARAEAEKAAKGGSR